MSKISTFQVISLDVWGNKKDGFEINDMYKTGFFVDISEAYTTKEILKSLKKSKFIGSYSDLSVDKQFSDLFSTVRIVIKSSGQPFCELQLSEEN